MTISIAAALLLAACAPKTTAPVVEEEEINYSEYQTSNPEGMQKVYEFLKNCGTYYIATVDGDQARVRPFGTINIFEGKLYIQTGKVKPVSQQLAANSKAEICAFNGSTGAWIRVAGDLINDDSRDVKVAMLEKYPNLKGMYNPDDDNTQVLYFKDATATISSFTAAPEVIKL